MLAHDRLDGLGSLIGVVEGDGADVVVQDVGLDNAVKKRTTDEAHLAIDSGGGSANIVPLVGGIMGQRRVGVLKESDGHCDAKLVKRTFRRQ